MELVLARRSSTFECVIGNLYIDGTMQCWTLELPILFDGQENVPNKCCIPEGTYPVVRYNSPKRGYMVPLLVGVLGRSEIEIHVGNTADNTDGCILLGTDKLSDTMIGNSKEAFEQFMPKFESALANGEKVSLTVENPKFDA